jgi:predicted alpha/beta-fold hydrolase
LFGFYDKHFGKMMKMKFSRFIPVCQDYFQKKHNIDYQKVCEDMKTVDDFHEKVICPDFGYENLQDYINKISPVHSIPNVKTPLFMLYSKNDPVIGFE